MTRNVKHGNRPMLLLLLEALGALLILVVIVWWTMFSGRKSGELKDQACAENKASAKPDNHSH
jgi:hypothetical protein